MENIKPETTKPLEQKYSYKEEPIDPEEKNRYDLGIPAVLTVCQRAQTQTRGPSAHPWHHSKQDRHDLH